MSYRRHPLLGLAFALAFVIGAVAPPVLGQWFGDATEQEATVGRVVVQGAVEPVSPAAPSTKQVSTTAPSPVPSGPIAGGPHATIEFLDVGQGDAILIASPEGKQVLVDAGTSSVVVKRLQERGVTSLDMVVVTHHHTDHYGGMDDVIRAFQPTYYLASPSGHTTSMYLKLLELVRDQGMTALQPDPTQPRKIHLGSVVVTVLPQPPEDKDEENNNSIGLRVTYGDVSVLLTGDSEENARDFWLQYCPDLLADCAIFKLAHHGSRNGISPELLDVVRPSITVASLGTENSYGHPHSETLALLQSRGLPLLRTDQMGTILIQIDGQNWSVADSSFASNDAGSRDPATQRASTSLIGTPVGPAAPPAVPARIDLNLASEAQLRTLPGVSPRTVQRIISGRPYQTVDDLTRVIGIDATRVAQLREYLTVTTR